MLEAISDIMITMGMLITSEISVAVTRSAPGNADRAKNTPQARVAPTGAENTALKTIASKAEASRTRPVLLRTKSCCSPRASVLMGDLLPPEHAHPGPPARAMATLTASNMYDKRSIYGIAGRSVKV